jgi:hypothetical protein
MPPTDGEESQEDESGLAHELDDAVRLGGHPEEEAWTLPGVLLLTEGNDGPVAIPELELAFMDTGVRLTRGDGELIWSARWSDLEELSTAERSVLPDGGDGVVVSVVERERHRRHRFVLPADDADTAMAAVQERARDHKLRTNRVRTDTAVRPALTIAVVVGFAATVTVLLLSATHVIHF